MLQSEQVTITIRDVACNFKREPSRFIWGYFNKPVTLIVDEALLN